MPAPPGAREVELLHRMLGAMQADGVEQLRDQVRMLQVHPNSDAALRIYVLHPDAPRAGVVSAGRMRLDPFPVRSPHGRRIGELSIWVEDGLLRALHYDRQDQQPVLVLPQPDWLELPAAPAPVLAPAPVAVATEQPEQLVESLPEPRRARSMLAVALGVMLLIAIAVVGFSIGASSGADLDAARAEGAAAGASDGAARGDVMGTYLGTTEGALNGRVSTYRPAFDAAQQRTMAAARAERLEAQRIAKEQAAAAAAAAPRSTDNTSCPGYRDATGYWVCS